MRKKSELTVKEIMRDYNARKEARRHLEASWTLNINFLRGKQYAEILPDGRLADSGKDYYWQARGVYNHIAPIVETRLAKFSTIGANVSVRPATSDISDVHAAKFSTKLLRSIEEENDLKSLIADANFWAEVCGTAFYKVDWAPDKGRRVGDGIYEGDVEISVCPPYEIYPDNLAAAELSDCRSIIHARAYPVEKIFDVWGVKVKGGNVDVITPEGVGGGRLLSEVKSDYAVVVEKYVLPDTEHPDGQLIIVAGDKLLYEGVLPYINANDGRRGYPFIRQVCLKQPASFFGGCLIDRLVPVQRAYNAVKNRKHEFLNRIAAGVLMVEDGSIDLDDLEEEGIAPGKVIVYRQGANLPKLLETGSVPAEFQEEEKRLLNEFVTISGVSDFLTSTTIATSTLSGVALNMIIEQDNSRLGITVECIRTAVKEVGRHILRLYKQFATTKRLKRVSGENGETELAYFTGNELSSDDLVFDVEYESAISPSAKKAMAKELIEMGIFDDGDGKLTDAGRLKILEIMGMGNWENALSTKELHLKRAARENLKLPKEAPEVADTDDHTLHIEEHTRYLISADSDLSQAARDMLSEHIRRHRELLKTAQADDKNTDN